MLVRGPRINRKQFEDITRFFAKDLTATQASDLAGVNRKTGNLWYNHFRGCIAYYSQETPRLGGKIEIDQATFGHRAQKKKKAWRRQWDRRKLLGLKNKKERVPKESTEVQVFGILQRKGDVYAQVIPNVRRDTLLPIIHMIVEPKAIIFSDEWRAFKILRKDGYKHQTVNHSRAYRRRGAHINGIESFWSFSKRRMLKFNGLPKSTIPLHIKECEWRYNNRGNIDEALKEILDRAND